MLRNNLFIKICLSFWLTTLFMIGAVVTIDWLTDTGPFHSMRFPVHGAPLAVPGHAFAWILEHEGASSLNAFADHLRDATGMQASFFDDQGNILTGGPGASDARPRTDSAIQTGGGDHAPPPDGGFASLRVVGSGGKQYTITATMPPRLPPPSGPHPPWFMTVVRLLAVLTVSGLICYLLARYLTAPVLQVGLAARRLAGGDLSTRVAPSLGKRNDEIARLALDFDNMAERIETLLNSQRTLLRDISHELRSPLARLNVALELCRKGSAQEVEKCLGRIEKESGRLNDLIGHLLTLTRVESGIFTGEKTQIDMANLIRGIVEDADFEAKSLNRRVKAEEIEACLVEGDEELLRGAIENVARNAVRYTDESSAVTVSLRCIRDQGGSNGLIAIRDQGMGVPEESLPNLFRPFYRVGNDRDRETGGTGLGLAITKATVRLHGGAIRAVNAAEGGLIIEISLPALPAPDRAQEEPANGDA